MLNKKEQFYFVYTKEGIYYERGFGSETTDLIDLALDYVEEDPKEEIKNVLYEILNSPKEYGLEDDFIWDLIKEWLSAEEILTLSHNVAEALADWIGYHFIDALSHNLIKIMEK